MSQQVNDTIDSYLKSMSRRIEELEAALREIADHPHIQSGDCDFDHFESDESGCIAGHKCCADIAQKALEKE